MTPSKTRARNFLHIVFRRDGPGGSPLNASIVILVWQFDVSVHEAKKLQHQTNDEVRRPLITLSSVQDDPVLELQDVRQIHDGTCSAPCAPCDDVIRTQTSASKRRLNERRD